MGGNLSREPVEHLSGVMIRAVRPDQPKRVILEKPSLEMNKHIKPLYIKAHLNNKPFSRILVDNGSAINVIPLRLLNALGKSEEDLISTDITISAFTGEFIEVSGVLPIEITIGSKWSLTAFFVVESSASYNILLGRDWIHDNWYVPSSLHQFLLFWKDNDVEVVWADNKPFNTYSDNLEASNYDVNLGPLKFSERKVNGDPRNIHFSREDMKTKVQEHSDLIYKEKAIVPYTYWPMEKLIVEEIDD